MRTLSMDDDLYRTISDELSLRHTSVSLRKRLNRARFVIEKSSGSALYVNQEGDLISTLRDGMENVDVGGFNLTDLARKATIYTEGPKKGVVIETDLHFWRACGEGYTVTRTGAIYSVQKANGGGWNGHNLLKRGDFVYARYGSTIAEFDVWGGR